MPIKPSDFLYFPVKNGEWLRDSQGKPRVYRSAEAAYRNLQKQKYDAIQVYVMDDILSREVIERGCGGKAERLYNEDGGFYCGECGCFYDDYCNTPSRCVRCGLNFEKTSSAMVDREYRLFKNAEFLEDSEYPKWLLELRTRKKTKGGEEL